MGEARGWTAEECECQTRATHRTVIAPWQKLPGGHRRLMGCARSVLGFLPGSCRASPILRAFWGPVVGASRSPHRRMGVARGWTAEECECQTRATHRTVVAPWKKLPGGHRRLMGCARSVLGFLPGSCRASPILRAFWGPVVRASRSPHRRMGVARGWTAEECECQTRATHRTVIAPWQKLPGGHRRLMGCARSVLGFLPGSCRASPILRAFWGPVVGVGPIAIAAVIKSRRPKADRRLIFLLRE